MQNTTNYGLKKPGSTDYINISDLNDNADIIDTQLKENADGLTSHKNEDATLTQKGHVQLSNATDSDSETMAATSKAVKTAYDLAEQAFQSASNGKSSVVSVIGKPVTTDNTFNEIAEQIQITKNKLGEQIGNGINTIANSLDFMVNVSLQGYLDNLATELSKKGQSAVGTEGLYSMVKKVSNISTGKKWASGDAGFFSISASKTITGLSFIPSVIILYSTRQGTIYQNNANYIDVNTNGWIQAGTTVVLSVPTMPTTTEFTIKNNMSGYTITSVKWLAIE